MSPVVSVVLPTYQGARYLAQTLDSVLAQTLTDLEVVAADDASTDGTAGILAAYAARDARVRIVPTERNLGAVPNWNRALAAARGDYVKVMGQDDLLHPSCLEQQVQVLRRVPTVGGVVAGRDVIDDRGRRVLPPRAPLGGAAGAVSVDRALSLIVRSGTNSVGEPVTVLLRRSVTDEVGPFRADLPYVVDLDYWCRSLEVAPLYVLSDWLCSFRVSAHSWSAALAADQGDQMCSLFTRLHREHPRLVTGGDVRRGRHKARLISRARRAVYVGLRMRTGLGALRRRLLG